MLERSTQHQVFKMAGSDTTNDQKVSWKPPSESLKRLYEILKLRRQPWAIRLFETAEEKKAVSDLNPYTPQELESILAVLPAVEHAHALAMAAVHGDLEIAKRLDVLYGPISMVYSPGSTWNNLNGGMFSPYEVKAYLGNAHSSAEIAELMEWLPHKGLGWMVGVGQESAVLLNYNGLEKACAYVRDSFFRGELPRFMDGKIEQPELLLALHKKRGSSAYPEVYDHILCWVPEGVVDRFPDGFAPFEVRHCIQIESTVNIAGQDKMRWVPLAECDQALFDSLENEEAAKHDPSRKYKAARYSDLELKAAAKSGLLDPLGDMLLGHMADASVRHGFWGKPGMVLCRTTVSFLSEFEIAACQPENLEAVQGFMKGYAPIDLIAQQNADPTKLSAFLFNNYVGYKRGREGLPYATNDLLSRLNAEEPLRSQVREVLPTELMQFLVELTGSKLRPASLAALYDQYGIDNSSNRLNLTGEDIESLHNLNYRFAPETQLVSADDYRGQEIEHLGQVAISTVGMFDWTQERYEGAFQKAISMGLWPTLKTAKPESVSSALVSLAKRRPPAKWVQNEDLACLRGYLREAGAEQCAAAAKSEKQWVVLADVFGSEALSPYLKKAPLKATGKIFASDLGL